MSLRTLRRPEPPEEPKRPKGLPAAMAAGPEGNLRRLRRTDAETHPFGDTPDRGDVVATYVRMTHAMADFVDATRANGSLGYAHAVGVLQGLAAAWPTAYDADTAELAAAPTAEEPPR